MSRWVSSLASSLLLAALSVLVVGCESGAPPSMDGGPGGAATARFELGDAPLDFGAIPFPDDLYLVDGHVEVGELPSEENAIGPAFHDALRTALRDLDGFGANSPVFFYFDGDIDPGSLPATPATSLRDDASVYLIDVDPASPTRMERVPAQVRWNGDLHQLAIRPWDGHPLVPGRMYAAVVTNAVRAGDGSPIVPAAAYAAIRDAETRPTDPRAGAAWDEHGPVLASLASVGTSRETVAALAVFHVQGVTDDLADARALVRDAAPRTITIRRAISERAELDALLGVPAMDVPGTDVEGGVQHSHIGWVIDGTFSSPNLVSEQPFVHGRWERDASGALRVKREETVWFTLVLPLAETLSELRVVVFQHGLGSERGAMFAVADALAAAGYAVIALDIPFHGMRAAGSTVDARHTYGASEGPDLFGDLTGGGIYFDFIGVADTEGGLAPFHPCYPRDVFRQSVVDLMGLVDLVDRGDWSGLEAAGGPAGVGFSDEPLGFVGISLGSILGTTFVASEERIGAAVLNVGGGNLSHLVAWSPSFNGQFLPVLFPSLAIDVEQIDYQAYPPSFYPEIAIYQTLLDRGDSMALAPVLAQRQVHVLLQMARDDETVPNVSTEGLARAIGGPMLGGAPRYTDLEESTEATLSRNYALGAMQLTRGMTVFEPATHGLLSRRMSSATVEHPPTPPFVTLATPRTVENPVDDAVQQATRFFETWRAGAPEITAP